MKLSFERSPGLFSGNTNVYAEDGNVFLKIKKKFSLGQIFCFHDASDNELVMIKGCTPSFLAQIWTRFDIYKGNAYIGMIKKNAPFSKPLFAIDYQGLYIDGNPKEDEFRIANPSGDIIATVNRTESYDADYTYSIDIPNIDDALSVLIITFIIHLGVDAPHQAGGG